MRSTCYDHTHLAHQPYFREPHNSPVQPDRSGISLDPSDDGLLQEGLTAHDATVSHRRQVDGAVLAVGEELAEGPAHPGALIEGLCCIANC